MINVSTKASIGFGLATRLPNVPKNAKNIEYTHKKQIAIFLTKLLFIMKKVLPLLLVFLPFIITLLGHPVGGKTASMSVLYGLTATISLFLLVMYCLILRNKDKWFLLLFSSVFIVNVG